MYHQHSIRISVNDASQILRVPTREILQRITHYQVSASTYAAPALLLHLLDRPVFTLREIEILKAVAGIIPLPHYEILCGVALEYHREQRALQHVQQQHHHHNPHNPHDSSPYHLPYGAGVVVHRPVPMLPPQHHASPTGQHPAGPRDRDPRNNNTHTAQRGGMHHH